ncbi:hypothetical protein MKW98_028729 [Papaver atlanticum]|uniref:Protein kinase domain-containing protein n=1 Tax=Papaver atlanticum TaxID=357466 RepID=A0AAD4S9N8_9MAGN|nr:hypothetical protein MKW98_028729 [Papaver atlanticum]
MENFNLVKEMKPSETKHRRTWQKKLIFRFGGSSSNNAEDYTGITKFKFQELAAATKNFASESLLGEGEYGRTFKGCLQRSGQDVAIRQVDVDSIHKIYSGHEQTMFSTIHMCSLLHHPNIVDLIGCSINDKNQMFLVYEFIYMKKPLDWNTRMKIAAGAAKGLKYLHDKFNPPAVHGNIKPSNILIGEGYEPKLSDFLVLKERIPEHDESSYASFGLVLLELISGRKEERKPSLVEWAKRKLVYGKEFTAVADPLLNGHYPEQGLCQALTLAAECLRREDVSRPHIGYVAVGSIEKEKPRELWQHAWFDFI